MEEKKQLKTNRSFPLYVLLDIITGHIYQAFMLSKMSKEINIVAKDGKKTMDYMKIFVMLLLACVIMVVGLWCGVDFHKQLQQDIWNPDLKAKIAMAAISISLIAMLVLLIVILIWTYRITNRIGGELQRRELKYKFNASTFWYYFIIPIVVSLALSSGLEIVGLSENVASLVAAIPALVSYVYFYKLIGAMNCLNKDYNERGDIE